MPKLIDYPRTSYTGAWEVAEIVDDTGGKCALETCARKLNRKVSGSFKAIVGSAVKFGLLTSKREQLTTTTLFRRIKHAYDKQEELLFHREAFLTPALFTQLCRKFRSRELPVAMLDVLLMREFDVEEINAQSVAKAFIEGAHMVGVLDEHNVIADIDQLAAQRPPRRELASPTLGTNSFRQAPTPLIPAEEADDDAGEVILPTKAATLSAPPLPKLEAPVAATRPVLPRQAAPPGASDAIASLFGLGEETTGGRLPTGREQAPFQAAPTPALPPSITPQPTAGRTAEIAAGNTPAASPGLFRIELVGPGINTRLDVVDADDLALVRALLDKLERQLKR